VKPLVKPAGGLLGSRFLATEDGMFLILKQFIAE